MQLHTGQLRFSTEGDGDVVDLTEGVQSVIESSGVENGTASVFVPGSTAAVTAMGYEPGAVQVLRAALEPLENPVGAAVLGPSETVPVRDGVLQLGERQQLVLVDFDDRPRQRTVVVQVIG